MPVKKVQTPVKTIARKVSPAMRANEFAGLTLPDEPKEADTDLGHYTLLLYGREKIGKTTILSSYPEAIFFATEPGTKGLRIFEFNSNDGGVRNWDIFRKGVDLLIANPGKFKTVVIDTVDRAYDMCLDWVCANKGIEYPGTDSAGSEDYGKSWRAVKMEFLEQMHRISQSGRGICLTSHSKEQEIKTRSGDKYTRIFPTMSNQARAVVEAMVDLFFYAEYIRGADGSTQRILICQGDETIWAGARETVAAKFPQFLPMDKDDGYAVIRSAFLGEYEGLDAGKIVPGKSTTKTARDFLAKAKTKSAVGGAAAVTSAGPKKIIRKI